GERRRRLSDRDRRRDRPRKHTPETLLPGRTLSMKVTPMATSGRGKTPYVVRPPTAVLTRGFDPRLSVGSARPAVFRSSTFVFSSPEAAERAFSIALGRSRPADGESVDLIYSRLSHPNAEILEDQIVPLETGATDAER
ncbi:MAG: PLP-dependent transferase, partial [Beijerinckiaceae bacterium]|nr:PLP-dependent transferase [Beijerinckiaceae bacterium]